MWYEKMFVEIESMGNAQQAIKMSAYMQEEFSFLGIPKPALNKTIRPYLKSAPKEKAVDWTFVHICWNKVRGRM